MSSVFQWSLGYKVLAGLAGSYAVLSIVFFIFPQLIHKQKYLKRKVKAHNFMVIGHRGGACEAPENTLEAFEYARDIGVDVIELDCHLTKDNKIVVAHDNNLYRICGVDRFIFEYDYEDLPEILDEDSGQRTPAMMKFFTPKRDFASTEKRALKLPLLEDVFRKCPDMYFNIDLKANDNLLITEAHELIMKYNMERKVVWGSFREMTVKKCQALNPDIDSYFSLFGIMKLIALTFTGLLPFVSLKETHFEVLYPNAYLRLPKLPWSIYILCYIAKIFLTRRLLVRHLQLRGINVYYWVLNDTEDFESAIRLGADGVMTDYPQKLIDHINRKHPELIRPSQKGLRNQVA